MNAQIGEILGSLTNDFTVWLDITSSYEVDLFCGFFLGTTNSGFSLSPHSLSALGQRGIEITFDIYAQDQDDLDTHT